MFRAREKSMLELALCDVGINAKVGLGKQIIDMITEHGNWCLMMERMPKMLVI